MLSHVQRESADICKENVLEDLEKEIIEYKSVGEFLMAIKKEFGGGDEKLVKVAELKKLEQGGRIMEEFVQEFKRAAQGSGYKGRPLLQSMPPRDSMDMGKGYDNMIGCATCSLSQRLMQKMLLPCFIFVVSSCFNPRVCLIVRLWTCINSVDTFMYPYTLPILFFLILSQVFA